MDSLDSMVAQVQALSGTLDDLAHLASLLKAGTENVVITHPQRLSIAIGALDPAKHSLGYLYLLDLHSSGTLTREQAGSFVTAASKFLTVCSSDQVRLAVDKFNIICRRFKDQAMQIMEPSYAILPLYAAIRKLQPSTEYLTPIHADYLLMCLLAKTYKAGLKILEDIFEIDQKRTGLVPRDFLLYCYYGGMICVGLKRFGRALELFQHAVTAPASVLNAITIASYKKYVLVCLICNGQVPILPKYTPSIVQRNLKSCAQDYADLANHYNNRQIADVKRCVNTHEEVFKNDNNLGLAKQVISSLYKRNIQRLTQTYLTLSLQDIARTVQLDGPKDAELHILQMIQDGEIFATINQKDGMVSFLEDPEQYNTRRMADNLDSEIQHIIGLAKKLTAVDEQILLDQNYLSKVGRDRTRYDADDFELVPKTMYTSL